MATDGERWTRDELMRLRDARFAPAALARFLGAAQRRANRVRRARPGLARQERLWAAAGVLAWLVPAAAAVEPFRRRLRSGLSGWAATILMLDWHLGMVETADGRPRMLGAADAVTLTRAWLVPAVADSPHPALCAIGFVTDAVDGPLARASAPTRLGRDLEGLVDAAFTGAVLRGARRRGRIGRFPAFVEAARLSAGGVYGVASYLGAAARPDPALLGAARLAAPLRTAALVAVGAGRRRPGELLLLAGSGTSLAAVALTGFRSAGRAGA